MNEPNQAVSSDEHPGGEYLAFRLGDEDYGVDILRVQEIRGWEAVTRIPNSPPYVKGVLNLRGAIVPIFDLRQRLGMPLREYTKNTVVIVLRVKGVSSERNIGVVVDEVSDVISALREDIRATPQFGVGMATKFIVGLVDVVQGGTSAAGGQGGAGAAVVQGGTSAAGGQGGAGAATEGKMVMLLDVDRLLSHEETAELDAEDAA